MSLLGRAHTGQSSAGHAELAASRCAPRAVKSTIAPRFIHQNGGAMGALVILLILLTLTIAARRWGVDSRHTDDPRDRYWWPNG
jgi:hypothetical protein